MKKYDVLAIGELNVDLILTGLSSPPVPGRELIAETCTLTMGSSTAICAAGLAALGLKTAFAGKVGQDGYGTLAAETLASYGVDLSHLIVDTDIQTGITVSMSAKNNTDRAMVTYLGAISALRAEEIGSDLLEETRHIHVGSFFLQSALRPGLARLFERAHELGVTTSLDAGWDDSLVWDYGLWDVLRHTDVFLPNELEAAAIAKQEDIRQAALMFSERCRICAVKCGKKGAVSATGGKIYEAETYEAPVRDTTGAGDSFNAGFLCAFLSGLSIEEALCYGNACGSLSVARIGGASSCPTRAEAERVIRLGRVETKDPKSV